MVDSVLTMKEDLPNNEERANFDLKKQEQSFLNENLQENHSTNRSIDDLQHLKAVMNRECSLYSSVTLNAAFRTFDSESEREGLFNHLVDISSGSNSNNKTNEGKNNTLEKLFLSYNLLDKLPIQLSFLKHLKVLDLKHNNFHEIPFKFLPISLTILEISNNCLDKNISLSTTRANELVNLKYLNLNDNNFTSITQLTNLLKLPNLKIVDVNNISDLELIPVVSKDFLTNLRSYLSSTGANGSSNNGNTNNSHSRYNEYFKRLSVLPEDISEELSHDGNSSNSSIKLNGSIVPKVKTSLFKKPNPNLHQSTLSQEIGRSRTPTHIEISNNQSMFGAAVRSRTSSVSEGGGNTSSNMKKTIIQPLNPNNTQPNNVLHIKKNPLRSKSRKNSLSNINSTHTGISGAASHPLQHRVSSFSTEHKSHLLDDSNKIDLGTRRMENHQINKEALTQARKKSQIIKYDKLLICCRRLLFTFTESQQTLRRVTQFGKDKTVAMNVVQLLYSTSHAIDNLVEVLEKCEEEESLNSTNDNSKKILIKTCQDIFPVFKQIFKLLNNNFDSFFQNIELCFLRMFYMNLMNSYTELYNAYMIIKHKSEPQFKEETKRTMSITAVESNENTPIEASNINSNEESVIINSLSNGKTLDTGSFNQNAEILSANSTPSNSSHPPVVTPTLISPPTVPTFQRSRSNTFVTAAETIISPNVLQSNNPSFTTESSTNSFSEDSSRLQQQSLSEDKKLLSSLKSLHNKIDTGIVEKICAVIDAAAFPGLSQNCNNCKTIDRLLSSELLNLDLDGVVVNKTVIWDLMSQQIKAVLLFLSAIKQNLAELTNTINDDTLKESLSQELSSLAKLTKEITILLDKSSFKQQ